MTESEARTILKAEIIHHPECSIFAEALGIAIQALEKQIPKKVRYEDVGYEQYGNVNVYACICPSCDLEIIKFDDNDVSEKCESDDVEKMFHSSMVHHAYIGLNNYCNRCGQKLDWSDDE